MYLTSAGKKFRRNLVFRPMVRRNSSSGFVMWTSADSMVFPRISAELFSAELNITKCGLSSADLGFFSAESHKSGDA